MNFQRGAFCSSQDYLYASLFSLSTLPWELLLPCLPTAPSFIFSTHGDCLSLPGFSLPAPWPGNLLQTVGWNNLQAHFICYSSLRDHFPSLSDIQYPEYYCLLYFVHFISCFKWEDKSCHCSSISTIHFKLRWISIINNIQVSQLDRRPSTMMWQLSKWNPEVTFIQQIFPKYIVKGAVIKIMGDTKLLNKHLFSWNM